MATATLPEVPRRWRQELPREESLRWGLAPRQLRLWLLAAGMLMVLGVAVGMLQWIVLPPAPRFVPLWVNEYRCPLVAASPATEQDRRSILSGGYFAPSAACAVGSLERHQFRQELAALEQLPAHESVVIYLSACAACNAAGQICVMPADFIPGEPRTLLPLQEILQCIERCASRHKLLVLDLMRPVADARLGILANEASARVADELGKLEDPHLLVLCAASAWQTSQASSELGHTVFGYYFEQGLRGYSDGWGAEPHRDGRVSVRELAAYLEQRVDHWVWQNRHERQTPWLAGRGQDFELTALPHGRPLPPHRPKPLRGYPTWLLEAWKTRDTWRAQHALMLAPRPLAHLEHALIAAEQAWSLGEESSATLQADLQIKLASWSKQRDAARLAVTGPPPQSLAALQRQGLAPDPKVAAALSDYLAKLAAQTAGLQAAPALAVRQTLTNQVLDQLKSTPPAVLALAICEQLANETQPQPDLVRLLNRLLIAHQPQPRFAETALLAQLARLADQVPVNDWPTGIVRRAIQVTQQGENAASYQKGLKSTQSVLDQAGMQRHRAETILFHPGYASCDEAEHCLQRAAALYEEAEDRLQTLEEADTLLAHAIALVQAVVPQVDEDDSLQSAWMCSVRDATDLAEALEQLALEPADPNKLAAVRQPLMAVRRHVDVLTAPFLESSVKPLIERLRRADAGPPAIRQADLLLTTPCLTADNRAALWYARHAAAHRLALLTSNRELRDGAARQSTTELESYAPQVLEREENDRATQRGLRSLAILRLGGIVGSTHDVIPSLEIEKQLARSTNLPSRDRLARIYPPQAPCELLDQPATNPTLLLWRAEALASWQWLASWYRYLTHDIGNESFYATAASEYLGHTGGLSETWVQFDAPRALETPRSPSPLNLAVPWRVAGPHASGISLPARLLLPTNGPWTADLEQTMLRCGDPVRVCVQPTPVAPASGVPPRGCLLQVTLNDRVFHCRVPLADLSSFRQWDLSLSPNPNGPEPRLQALRLRPVHGPQLFYLYAYNGSPSSRQVIVQLNGSAASSKILVSPGQWRKISLNGAPPKDFAELPSLGEPLIARVLDAETGESLTDKAFHLGVASPREYVAIDALEFIPTGLKPNRLSLRVRALPQFTPPPCQVELVLPPERIEGLDGVKGGMLRGLLTAPETSLNLFAEGIRLSESASRVGSVYVNIDACPRAFVFRTLFSRQGEPTTPLEYPQPDLRLLAPSLALSGPGVSATLQVDQGPTAATLLLDLGTAQPDGFTVERSQAFPSSRENCIGFSPFGPDGSLLFTAAVRDWQASLDCTGIVGHRLLRARLIGADGKTIAMATHDIALDDSPPARVQFVNPPTRVAKGKPVLLVARGGDDLSGIVQATFFVGKPLAQKLPPQTTAGTARPGDSTEWSCSLELPPDASAQVTVGAQLTNGVGLASVITTTVEIVDPKTLTLGRIEGRVLEGPRPQAGLSVVLKDEKGTEIATTSTDEQGAFLFEQLAPGKFVVSTAKQVSLRKAEATVTLQPGQTASVPLSLAF